ncbi:Metallo-beta-lactamase superfamily [Rubrobacter radiotolerans]|uniref:MBL fold metallo-hydrolase n=1 Tax=Rubrobacter radiotolerans TaxID=42256 RepID=A0A023X085_RUBRA|nr:MBL fold metallo-hydrolase [Rubrobacter radiotolerans]AHY45581.1 Metallo-beta-lactamase superfamily [Rubrobacter radiotolerans]MDX5892995.1 MBL fold metallo-hydrolase [Rubrobacter radiotolerans]SMC02873.1 Glyoxylase, beta-lactamase superfamily II [Rubrobacter radiotolerans DSM 5868]
MRIETLDLGFQGRKEVIASYLLTGGGSAAIVETGPASCLEALLDGIKARNISPEDVEAVFLTHIHLDHAGGSGHVAEALPNARFYVHEVGAPHIADPSKLWKSASRIYGEERMEELWGEAKPVPGERITALEGEQESVPTAGGRLVAYDTPGHAYHHLAFFDPESRSLFAGDVAGVRLPGRSYVRPPTTPPEVHVEAWTGSIQRLRSLQPDFLYPTHFGGYTDVSRHLDELEVRLMSWLATVEERMEAGEGRDEIASALKEKGDAEMTEEGLSEEDSSQYDLAGNYGMLADGLMRYVTKKNR